MQNANDVTAPDIVLKTVQKYYDYTRRFYRVFWHGDTNALHYGFYDESTKTHKEALLKTIAVTSVAVKITSSDKVVDLGCGIGGSAFWIARNIGARVMGITLSGGQYEKAKKLCSKYGLEAKVDFVQGNFFSTSFADEQFDVAIGVEALCHGQHMIDELAREMFRIVKRGGRIAVMDGYLGTKELSESEKKDVKVFEEGFALVEMITPDTFIEALGRVGFREVFFTDYTENILPTGEKMYMLAARWHTFIKIMTTLHIIPDIILKNNNTGLVQEKLFKQRALVYGCITAKK